MSYEKRIIEIIRDQAEIDGNELVGELNRDSILLETGLDSLGFATVVVMLEQEFNFDPFTATDEVVYPTTLGEFIDMYDHFKIDKTTTS